MAFHMNFMYLKLEIFEEWHKLMEIQIQEPVFDIAINQTPNTLSLYIKSETLQVIALESEEFEPERYEAPFTIPIFDKSLNKKKIFDDKASMEKKVEFLFWISY